MKKILSIAAAFSLLFFFNGFASVHSVAGSGIKTNKSLSHSAKEARFFTAKLSGKEVVPPVKTKGYGEATFEFSKDGKKLYYKLVVHHVDSVIMAHIHHASAGNDGPIAVWLYKGKPTGMVNGVLSKGTITAKQVNIKDLRKWMESGDTYVLVHTKAHPNGEIRGQIKKK